MAPTHTSATCSQSTSDGPDERLRIPARQLRREPDDRRALHAGVGDGLELLRLGHQQRRRLVGPDDARRVRVEGHHDRRRAALAGDAAHAIEDLAMAAVHAVEVAEREHRLGPSRRSWIVGEVNDVHRAQLDLQHQPIISQLHTSRQLRAGLRVRQIVADVREVRALGAETRDDVERFADAEMRRVRTMAQRVEHDRAHAVEQRPRLVGNAVAVGQVGERSDAEPEHRQPAVQTRHRHDLDAAEGERPARS